jgi:hypothetical protein
MDRMIPHAETDRLEISNINSVDASVGPNGNNRAALATSRC